MRGAINTHKRNSMSTTNKRVVADVAELQKPLYAEAGIYYVPDETDTMKGLACVFGPKDSPYEDCPMLYSFAVPQTFPFDPPKVLFHTYDGQTRFHPNMYKEGKVCLSILHTWDGPKWASTFRLSTVLVTLQSLMDADPISHEPGWKGAAQATHETYAKCVEYAVMCYIARQADALLQKKPLPNELAAFQEQFRERLPQTLERLEAKLTARVATGEVTFLNLPYSMGGQTQYSVLLERVKALKLNLANLNSG